MPLLNRQEVGGAGALLKPGGGLKPTDDVFVIDYTGDALKSYAEFADKHHQHSLPQWTDKYYGKGGLTYQDALAYEKHAEEQLRKQFPKALEGEAVRLIHHSTLRKDDLVSRLSEALKGALPGDSDQRSAAGADEQQTQAAQAQGTDAAAKRSSAGVTKKLLTHFLLYVADKQKPGVWVCKEPWVRKYSLKSELPEGLQPPPAAAAAADAAGPSSPGPSGTASTREGTPMKSPTRPEAPRTLEEEEARLKPGTLKATAFTVMKARGVTGPVSAEDIVRITTTDGSRIDWTDKSKRTLTSVLSQDPTFVRVARGQYTLRCWEADLPALPADTPGASGGGKAAKGAAKDAAKDGGEAMEGSEAPASGGEQSGLARAEQLLVQALKAVAARRGDASAANDALNACVKRLADAKAESAKAKQSPAKGGGAGVAVPPSPNKDELDAKFALPKRLQDFTGPDDDRKAKLLWRQEKAAEEKRLAQERAAYVQQLRLDAAKASRAGTDQLQAAVDRAKKAAEDAAAKLGRALKAESDAKRAVEREKQREMLKDIKEKSKADKEKQKQADKELREKRKQEALAAKRYPIDDLELLSEELSAAAATALASSSNGKKQKQQQLQPSRLLPPEQTDLPCIRAVQPLEGEASQQLSRALYVSDTLTQFARQLGVKGASLAELEGVLDAAAAAAAVGGANLGGDSDGAVVREALQWLACTYQRLLKVLLRDVTDVEGAARVYARWEEALDSSAGAWPDILRRWVQTQAQEGMASPDARAAAEFLRTRDAAGLSKQQHLALLTQLLDDVLDTSLMRGLLATRLEEAHEAAAGLREQLTEARRKLREAQDEERELKKRKRAAALALATAAAERQLRELGQLHAGDAAADGGEEDGDAAAGGGGGSGGKEKEKDAKSKEGAKIKAARKEIMERAGLSKDKVSLAELEAELADRDEVEPSWDLPDELLQYSGPVGDKKAMSEFRRKQQEERKRLDKAKTKWHSEKSKRAKERSEARKREIEAEKVLARERAKAEEEVTELADKFEAQEGRYAVRRQPLGSDRFNRCYWWGLAGAKDALLLQQEAGAADATLGLLAAAAVEGAQAAAAPPSASTLMAGAFGGKQQDAAAGSSGGSAAPGEEQQQRAGQGPGAVLDHTGLLLPRGAEAWALLEGPEAVESLMGCCEVRGVREKELKASLDKMLPAMSAAMAKAAAAKAAAAASAAADADGAAADGGAAGGSKGGAAGKKKGKKEAALAPQEAAVAHRALPSRHARSAAAEQIRKTGTAAPKEKEVSAAAAAMAAAGAAAMGGDDEDATGPFFGWQLAAVKSAVGSLAQLTQPAAAAKVDVPPPATTWAQYRQQLQGLVHGEVPVTWQAATTAAAIELLTGRPQAEAPAAPAAAAEAGKDAAWARAVAAAGATPADAHGDDEAAARHAVLSQLRLQLLLWEQQLVAASGEARYLSQEGGDVVWGSEDAEEESEGEAADNAGDDDGMDVDEPQQQQQQLAAAGKGSKGKAADAKAARGLKRAGSSNVEAAADAAAAHEAPANKRRKTGAAAAAESPEVAAAAAGSGGRKGGAAAGLPPRPTARGKARGSSGGGAAAAAAAAAEAAPSREGSAAPASSGAPAAAAGGSRQKRGRGAPAAAAAASDGDASRDEGDDEAATGGRGKKAARVKAPAAAAAGRGKAAAAAADSGELEGSEDAGGVSEKVVKGRRLAHLKVLQGEQDDDPDEEVADADTELTHLPTQVRGRAVWRSSEERDSWRACVAASATAAGLAYCAAALAFHAQQPLTAMAARSNKAGGSKAKAKAAAAAEQQQQQHAAAAAAGSSKAHARRK